MQRRNKWIYWTKGPEDRGNRHEEKKLSTEEVHGCSEGEHPAGLA